MLRFRADMLIEHGRREAAVPVLLESLAGASTEEKREIQATLDRVRPEPTKAAAGRPERGAPPPLPAASDDEELLEVTVVGETTQD